MAFNGLAVGCVVLATYVSIHDLPSVPARPLRTVPIEFTPVTINGGSADFRLVGAWVMHAPDRRLSGLSGLANDGAGFAAISDNGAAIRFDSPGAPSPRAHLADLRDGHGPFGRKVNRDAEAIVDDGKGGWLVAYEGHHSVWRYDRDFRRGRLVADVDRPRWASNRGVEGMMRGSAGPIVYAQNGDERLEWIGRAWRSTPLKLGWQVADATKAPDGTEWLLLRSISLGGFDEAIAPVVRDGEAIRLGKVRRLPKAPFDNFEGLAIRAVTGGLRFWLVTDDGHRVFARNLLVAIDLPQTHESARR